MSLLLFPFQPVCTFMLFQRLRSTALWRNDLFHAVSSTTSARNWLSGTFRMAAQSWQRAAISLSITSRWHLCAFHNMSLSWPGAACNCDMERVVCHTLAGHVCSDPREWVGAGCVRGPRPREGCQSDHCILPWTFSQEVHDHTNLVRIKVCTLFLLDWFPRNKSPECKIWPELWFLYCQKLNILSIKTYKVSTHSAIKVNWDSYSLNSSHIHRAIRVLFSVSCHPAPSFF